MNSRRDEQSKRQLRESTRAIELNGQVQVGETRVNARVVRAELRHPLRARAEGRREGDAHALVQRLLRRVDDRVAQMVAKARREPEHAQLLILVEHQRLVHFVELRVTAHHHRHLVLLPERDEASRGVEQPRVRALLAPLPTLEGSHLLRRIERRGVLGEGGGLEELGALEKGQHAGRDAEEELRQQQAVVRQRLLALQRQRQREQPLRLRVRRRCCVHVRRVRRLQRDETGGREGEGEEGERLRERHRLLEEQRAQEPHATPHRSRRRPQGQVALRREADAATAHGVNDVLDLAAAGHRHHVVVVLA